MAEEVRITDYEDRIMDWETGLPSVDDLTPLSQSLISPELLSAFSISAEPYRNVTDVNRASESTLSNIRFESKLSHLKSVSDDKGGETVMEDEETLDLTRDGSDSRKLRRVDSGGDGDGAVEEVDDSSARTSKRHRLVWTPQLHKRFVEVVAHLGVKNAVPKTIMQLMNVEGLTRENVASHLQKYRLYLKRMHGFATKDQSASDNLFASTPVPQSFHESAGAGSGAGAGNGHFPMMVPMPYQQPQMVPNSFPYNMMMQQRDWSGNKFGAYQHQMTPNDK